MNLLYAAALVVSLAGMVILDHRFRLFVFHAPARAAVVLAVGVAFLVSWDVAGITLGIFVRGDSPYMTGLLLAPHLPVEEIGFLILLCYLTMNVYVALARVGGWRRGRRGAGGGDRGTGGGDRADDRGNHAADRAAGVSAP